MNDTGKSHLKVLELYSWCLNLEASECSVQYFTHYSIICFLPLQICNCDVKLEPCLMYAKAGYNSELKMHT